MTYALIDNSSLTAVQRIIGQVPTRSKDNVDIDLVAFENVIQAILFYDDIIVLDDYKEQFKSARQKAFPFIRFIQPQEFKFEELGKIAQERADSISPEIRGGYFTNDDYKELFNSLKTSIICNWELASSKYYLTMKALGRSGTADFDKYSNIAAGIFSEFNDVEGTGGKPRKKVKLYDSNGDLIGDDYTVPGARSSGGEAGGMTGALSAFIAALNWLINRTVFYTLAGEYLRADTFLYPTRQSYQPYYIAKHLSLETNYTKEIVEKLSSTMTKDIFQIYNKENTIGTRVKMPLFSGWLIDKVKTPDKIIEEALSMRESKEIKEARTLMRNLSNELQNGNLKEANEQRTKLEKEIEASSNTLRSKFKVSTPQGVPVTNLIGAYNLVANFKGLPELPDFDLKIPSMVDFKKKKGFSVIYRNLGDDLTTVWSLGKLRDQLGSKVQLLDQESVYHPKAEDPKYARSHSSWKSPM